MYFFESFTSGFLEETFVLVNVRVDRIYSYMFGLIEFTLDNFFIRINKKIRGRMQCRDRCDFKYLVSKRLFVAHPKSLLIFHYAHKITNIEFGFLRICCICSKGHKPWNAFLRDFVRSELYRSIYSRNDCFNKCIQFVYI